MAVKMSTQGVVCAVYKLTLSPFLEFNPRFEYSQLAAAFNGSLISLFVSAHISIICLEQLARTNLPVPFSRD